MMMRIAVINEISAADRNGDILNALEGRGHEVLNLGNTAAGRLPALLYIHTGLMSALLLHLKRRRLRGRRLRHRPWFSQRRHAVSGRLLRAPAHAARCLAVRPHQRRQLHLAGAQPGIRLGGRCEPAPDLRRPVHAGSRQRLSPRPGRAAASGARAAEPGICRDSSPDGGDPQVAAGRCRPPCSDLPGLPLLPRSSKRRPIQSIQAVLKTL